MQTQVLSSQPSVPAYQTPPCGTRGNPGPGYHPSQTMRVPNGGTRGSVEGIIAKQAIPPAMSYPPTIDELKSAFIYEHGRAGLAFLSQGDIRVRGIVRQTPDIGGIPVTTNLTLLSLSSPRIACKQGHMYDGLICCCTLWLNFLARRIDAIKEEAGLKYFYVAYTNTDSSPQPCFPELAGLFQAYDKLCKDPAVTPKAHLERTRMRELARIKEEERVQLARIKEEERVQEINRQLDVAAEKARQEAEKKQRDIFQHQQDLSNVKEWAAQKLKEEKEADERALAQKELAELFATQPSVPEFRAQDFMTTAQFRNMRARQGFPLNNDQHVCHIIAKNNGGADHIDNYYVAAGSLNQSLGDRNDFYLAEAAGIEQTRKAIAVSRTTGYNGPSAEELIAMGKIIRSRVTTGSLIPTWK